MKQEIKIWLCILQDVDDFFEQQKTFLVEYHNKVKDACMKADRMTKTHKGLLALSSFNVPPFCLNVFYKGAFQHKTCCPQKSQIGTAGFIVVKKNISSTDKLYCPNTE